MHHIYKRPASGAIVLLALCTFTLSAAMAGNRPQDDIQNVGSYGHINWTRSVLKAEGMGAIPRNAHNDAVAYLKARDYAELDALKNLLMVIKGIHINARITGADYMAQSSVIRAHVQGLIKGAQVVSERTVRIGRDQAVQVTVALPMYGSGRSVAGVFLPPLLKPVPENGLNNSSIPADSVSQPSPVQALQSASDNQQTDTPYTSVIIDARGFRVERSMSPKILLSNGSEVWGTVKANPNYVIDHGIAVYANSMQSARSLRRAGSHPLVLRAVNGGMLPGQNDVEISRSDADRLLSLNQRYGFLNRYQVILVLNPGS